MVAEGSGEDSSVSVQGVSLAVVKALTESMEPCSPAAQTPNPILTLTTFTVSYHVSKRSLKVFWHLKFKPIKRSNVLDCVLFYNHVIFNFVFCYGGILGDNLWGDSYLCQHCSCDFQSRTAALNTTGSVCTLHMF